MSETVTVTQTKERLELLADKYKAIKTALFNPLDDKCVLTESKKKLFLSGFTFSCVCYLDQFILSIYIYREGFFQAHHGSSVFDRSVEIMFSGKRVNLKNMKKK